MLDVENLDSDRDRCSLLWICLSVALEGDVISTVMAKVEAIILSHDFEPNIGFNPISARAKEAYIGIMYDLDIPSEYGRAIKCHDVVDWLISQGHLLFRLWAQSMENCHKRSTDQPHYFAELSKLSIRSKLFRPEDILPMTCILERYDELIEKTNYEN